MTGDGGWKSRNRAALAEHGEDEFDHGNLPELVSLFDHEDPEVRAGAVWRAAELAADDPRSVERYLDEVAARVSEPDAWVRRGATWAIQEIATARPAAARSAMDELLAALDDEDPLVVENAIVGIGSIAAEAPRSAARARNELATLARDADDPRLRRYAREALERIAERLPDDAFDGDGVDVRTPAKELEHVPSANVVGGSDEGEPDETHADVEERTADRERRGGNRRRAPIGGSSPPDSIPEPFETDGSLSGLDPETRIRSGPLLDVYRGRAETDTMAGTIPVEIRVLGREVRDRSDADEIAEALDEATLTWSRIDDHETVTTTLGRDEDPPRIVTEVADGRSFEEYARRSTFEESLYYASCLVRAVVHAHGHGVIHGGLSPRAVGFVEPIADAWHVPKVADWAVAPIVGDHLDRLPVPAPFAAPEQIAPGAFGAPDQATDVYGLGATLYALFAGRPPFGDDATDVAKRIRRAERGEALPADLPRPVPPSERDASLPGSVDDLVNRAMSRDRMQRYEAVADLQRDLDRLIADHASWG